MKKHLIFILIPIIGLAQQTHPRDYFIKPMDIPIVLSGTFGELRSNHFHSGVDIKTQQREGVAVVATAKGNVSRIKIQHYGYGKALYIDHPNGYTTVYAHLQSFSEKIQSYVKKRQYDKESYTIELFPKKGELAFEQGEVIGYSGNSGSSGGPHLHYEIRDSSERPLNPLMFGLDVKDTTKPTINGLHAYVANDSSHVEQSQKRIQLKLNRGKDGVYSTKEISAYGKIGFGIETIDQLDMAYNKNGVYIISCSFNGEESYELDYSRFSFSETRYLNRLIDFSYYKQKKKRIQKLFKEINNPLSIIKDHNNRGYLNISDNTSGVYEIKVGDYKGNHQLIRVPIKGKKDHIVYKDSICTTSHFALYDQPFTYSENGFDVYLPKHSLYEDTYLDIQTNGDTITLHRNDVPLHKRISIKFDVSNYSAEDRKKLFVSELDYKNRPTYSSTYKTSTTFETKTKTLGKYTLTIDNQKPKILPYNFKSKKWLSNYRYLKVKIADDLSGVRRYRATINGKFILMEYDYKKDLLTYDFNDNIITDTENKLKVIVTDNVGNSSTFETVFYRKVKTDTIESTN
ncbi:MAG: M23 family metallopeptidase [Flavobacteriaceae bacterium]|nr:M23 family metallopeptidase [Flavobacteriaceae bacterium]